EPAGDARADPLDDPRGEAPVHRRRAARPRGDQPDTTPPALTRTPKERSPRSCATTSRLAPTPPNARQRAPTHNGRAIAAVNRGSSLPAHRAPGQHRAVTPLARAAGAWAAGAPSPRRRTAGRRGAARRAAPRRAASPPLGSPPGPA